jgi:ubiquinol-cytochrome c reductase cytochrome c subunit
MWSRFATAAVLVGCLAGEARAQTATGNADKGKDVYRRYSCWACHGYSGNGGGAVPLVPMKLPLAGFTAIVRNPPTMPPYTAKVLTDAQLADVWAYVKTLPESPPAKSIPLLNQQ